MVKDAKRQLAVLFGESLVGPWPELTSNQEETRPVRRGRAWLWRLGALLLTALVVLGARFLVKPGLDRRSAEDRDQYAERLRMSLQDGHIEDAAQLVEILRGASQNLDAADPHFQEILRAEAAAYRYFDAKPERLARIAPYLRDGASAPMSAESLVARYTVLSREERAQHLAELEALLLKAPGDAELAYLVASAREQKGDVAGAREAYGRSDALGPAWLSHRFDQIAFEREQGNAGTAKAIAVEMLRSDPSSPWSRFAASLLALPVPSLAADADAPATCPVQVFRVTLDQAVQAAAQGDTAQAERLVGAAVFAVHDGPPFVIDAFDYLARHKSQILARKLTETQHWPKGSAIAAAKQQELAKAPIER